MFQDFKLFPFSCVDNITIGSKPNIERLQYVYEEAELSQRNITLDTILYKDLDENGVNISGGEAQMVAIARAIYRDAPIILMDEPTSALDPIMESRVYEKMNQSTKNTTSIFVSHRLSSCTFCDRIVVFQSGHIVESGSHHKLLNENRIYRKLWDAQAQYYQ